MDELIQQSRAARVVVSVFVSVSVSQSGSGRKG